MFRKQFKIKANHQMKMSDKEKLKKQFVAMYKPSEACLADLFAKKEPLSCVRVETFADEILHVYVSKKKPVLFDYNEGLFPTVYLLWQHPDLHMCEFTVPNEVVRYLSGGADLMAAGVVYPSFNCTSPQYYDFVENTVAYVNTTENRAAIAVGVTAQPSLGMLLLKGKAVTVYHVWGDKLCSMEGAAMPRPSIGTPQWMRVPDEQQAGPLSAPDHNAGTADGHAQTDRDASNDSSNDDESEDEDGDDRSENVKEMDDLLMRCFLLTAKHHKNLQLPILSSTFYKSYMVAICPAGQKLDVKKSSYKKLSNFLELLRQMGLLHVEKIKRGVDQIVTIDFDNAAVMNFKVNLDEHPVPAVEAAVGAAASIAPIFVEVASVTAKVLPLFSKAGHKKGDILEHNEIRNIVIDCVVLDALLKEVSGGGPSMKWNDLVQKLRSQMTTCYKVTGTDGEVQISKKPLQAIRISVEKRSGNKKVTIVENVQNFGINLEEFSGTCQKGVAASTTIIRSTSPKKADQLQIQGNQVLFIYQQLTEKYKIPKKYVTGLEYAPRKKK